MAKVTASANVDNFNYPFPVHDIALTEKLKKIQSILLPMADFFEKAFPGDDDIFLTWQEEWKKEGKSNPIEVYSPTIPIPDLILAHQNFIST